MLTNLKMSEGTRLFYGARVLPYIACEYSPPSLLPVAEKLRDVATTENDDRWLFSHVMYDLKITKILGHCWA